MNGIVPPDAMPLLETRDLSVAFDVRGRRVGAVSGLGYRLDAGQTLAIVGESGAGKTVACRALLGLLPSNAVITGSAKVSGTELLGLDEHALRRHRGADIAIVFQDSARSLNPVIRIGDQIVEAVRAHRRIERRDARERAIELLRSVRLYLPERQYDAYPHQLSGGMRHRALLAMALAGEPRILVADEATKSLDWITEVEILSLLDELRRERGLAILLVSHNLPLAARFADEVIVMQSGHPIERGLARHVLSRPTTEYTRRLLDAIPRFVPGATELVNPAADATKQTPLLAVRNLSQRYLVRGETLLAIDDVSFTIAEGETLGLIGETGSGKSTLARSLLQIPRPAAGSVLLRGEDLTRLDSHGLRTARRQVQMVFQDPFASLNPKWRIGEIVEEPLRGFRLGTVAERRRKVDELLDRVGLPPNIYRDRRPHQLSGGQCQRVAIARALAPEPVLIVCDEAVASLDVLIQKQIIDLFAQLRETLGLSYLFISHDLPLVARFCDRIAVLYRGRLREIGPTATVMHRPAHPYTASLLASLSDAPFTRVPESGVVRSEPVTTVRPEPVEGRALP